MWMDAGWWCNVSELDAGFTWALFMFNHLLELFWWIIQSYFGQFWTAVCIHVVTVGTDNNPQDYKSKNNAMWRVREKTCLLSRIQPNISQPKQLRWGAGGFFFKFQWTFNSWMETYCPHLIHAYNLPRSTCMCRKCVRAWPRTCVCVSMSSCHSQLFNPVHNFIVCKFKLKT